jgi:hypothetical protein
MSSRVRPEIFARIVLAASPDGGRRTPILSGEYRAILTVGGESFSARFVVPDGCVASPGDTIEVGVQFLLPEKALPRFRVGARFTVSEGRSIGEGVVLANVSASV